MLVSLRNGPELGRTCRHRPFVVVAVVLLGIVLSFQSPTILCQAAGSYSTTGRRTKIESANGMHPKSKGKQWQICRKIDFPAMVRTGNPSLCHVPRSRLLSRWMAWHVSPPAQHVAGRSALHNPFTCLSIWHPWISMLVSCQGTSLGLFQDGFHRCPFGLIWLKHRGPWLAWWFNELPRPSIFPETAPMASLLLIGSPPQQVSLCRVPGRQTGRRCLLLRPDFKTTKSGWADLFQGSLRRSVSMSFLLFEEDRYFRGGRCSVSSGYPCLCRS